MRLTIFSRIVIGYLTIFIPAAAFGTYAFSQLAAFHRVTNNIVQVDNRLAVLVQKIANSYLAQTRYERKYMILKDEDLLKQFRLTEEDVNKVINEALSIAEAGHTREVLLNIKDNYEQYKSTVNEEVELVKHKRPYLQESYKEKKEKLLDQILWDLRNLKIHTEQVTYEKIKQLGESGAKAYEMALMIFTGLVLLGIISSIFITRSVTNPLSEMRKRTRQVASGEIEGSLDLRAPPEIRDLARDFNIMCDKLKEMDKIKSDFFSLMAHELRMPLASIKEGTNLLMNGIGEGHSEKRKEILAIIYEECNHLINLVNSLLDLSKMESGMIALNFETTDVRSVIDKAVSGMEPLAMAKNLTINIDIASDLPHVKMDREKIIRALGNLIGNAVKFTPAGGHIKISAQPSENGVRISVADTGPGIPKEDLDAIFDKFQQVAMTSYNKIKGTGLGLAIVKHIINAHGGRVWAESKTGSETGNGSIFIFVLPV